MERIWVAEPTQLILRRSAQRIGEEGWTVLTAFRTRRGAESFLDMANAFGVHDLEVLRVRKSGTAYVGLGQEAHPDGHGPLLEPLADQAQHQR